MNGNTHQIESVLRILQRRFPYKGAMELDGPYQTLVGVVLSARTRDEQVLKLLPAFFKTFSTVHHLAQTNVNEIEFYIHTIGMFHQKAVHLLEMAKRVCDVFGGSIPRQMHEIVSLAGVGRKTASVLLAAAFDTPAIAVDTHVHRVTNRLGWVHTKNPQQTEEALLCLVPDEWKKTVNRVFVPLGRYVCIKKPRCWACPIAVHCAYSNKNLIPPKNAKDILANISEREATIQHLRNMI